MSRFRMWGSLILLPLLCIALASLGCGGGGSTGGGGGGSGSSPKASGGDGMKPSGGGDKTPIEAAGWATIKGKVSFDGTPPPPKKFSLVDATGKPVSGADYCEKGNTYDPTWTVDAGKGLANVVVWLKAPAGKFFDVPADQQKPANMKAKVDQPFCAFEPHVQVLFPTVYDAKTKKQKPTGQTFEVDNSATITHNTNYQPSTSNLFTGANPMLQSKGHENVELNSPLTNKPGLEDTITLKCNIHPWMTGYIWAFDHPYAAVSKPDGTFEIKNVPAGSELRIVAWHEKAEYVLPEGKGSKEGTKVDKLNDKEVREINIKVAP